MIKGVLNYNCKCCNSPVKLLLMPTAQKNTYRLFEKMFNAKLCVNCHTDKHVPETAEAIKVFLVGK